MKNSSMGWDKERLTELTLKYMQGELTVEEQAELDVWLNSSPGNRERFEARVSEGKISEGLAVWYAAKGSKVRAEARMDWGKRIFPWRRMAVAAAILVGLVGGGMPFLFKKRVRAITKPTANKVIDLPPGSNKAMLTLADGSKIALDTARYGAITRQGSSVVSKLADGTIAYQHSQNEGSPAYNSIVTPRGGQYMVVLPDGTKVWLDAASSIRFPTAFMGKVREVDMTGEAYFEVKHSLTMPFRVHARGQVITDIGTHFNIEAYEDEPAMKTTLEEGSVKMGDLVLSERGEQAIFEPVSGRISLEKGVDTEQVLAWKEGMFEFENADLETVLKSLGRWYDFDAKFEAAKDTVHLFTGQLSKSVSVTVNLRILEKTGYHLQVQGRNIVVLP